MTDENAKRPTVEGVSWGKSFVDAEIEEREAFGAALGRKFAEIPAVRAAADFSAFCEMIAQAPYVWERTDFITLSAAWKSMRATTPSDVGRAGEAAADGDPQGGSGPTP